MRNGSNLAGTRASALWGRRTNETRKSALWGKGGRGTAAVVASLSAFAVVASGAGADKGKLDPKPDKGLAAVPSTLVQAAQSSPGQTFNVIVQAARGKSESVARDAVNGDGGNVKRRFKSVAGVSASLSGKQLLNLINRPGILSVTPDVKVAPSSYEDASMWRNSAGISSLLGSATGSLGGLLGGSSTPALPAIAIVDSGIDSSKSADFGNRVVAHVNLSSLSSSGVDEEGHGTMVAGVAAGQGGAAPTAPLVDVRTADASGQSMTSDVIAACDWILQNKGQYNIRVANLSLNGATESSFRYDPLDKAVESLWFNGVVVVTAAGNQGSGGGNDPMYAPANDPFVITVGALDQHMTSATADDSVPSWSAYGHTIDGFAKPELSAPGRYMVMPVPMSASIPATVPDRIVGNGYMWMSGTSFAAPVVSGAAAQILAKHPAWSPGQVKGALMETASPTSAGAFAGGVGEVNAAAAVSDLTPPNANENLDAFVTSDGSGSVSFDGDAWAATAGSSASWSSASWSSASWSSASWSSASWSSASWSSASWSSASWSSASWSSASWGAASWLE